MKKYKIDLGKDEGPQGPIAMLFYAKVGWFAETLGLKTKHWKRLAREIKGKSTEVGLSQETKKRTGPTPLQELDPKIGDLKKKKKKKKEGKNQRKLTPENEEETVGAAVKAAM